MSANTDTAVPPALASAPAPAPTSAPAPKLACTPCRTRRVKCDHATPMCGPCVRAEIRCEFPAGRKRKRTKFEMQANDPGAGAGNVRLETAGSAGARTEQPAAAAGRLAAPDGGTSVGESASEMRADAPLTVHFTPGSGSEQYVSSLGEGHGSSVAVSTRTNAGSAAPLMSAQADSEHPLDFAHGHGQEEDVDWMALLAVPPAFDPSYLWPLGFPELPISALALGPGPGPGPEQDGGPLQLAPSQVAAPGQQLEASANPASQSQSHNHSADPNVDLGSRLRNALQGQQVMMQGDPRSDRDLELYYYRFSGSTAMQPGINRVNLRLRKKKAGLLDSVHQPAPAGHVGGNGNDDEAMHGAPSPSLEGLFDEDGMPLPHVREPLFEVFYAQLSQHFPAISRRRMNERFESGTMSHFLANCICALSARFAPDAEGPMGAGLAPCQRAAPFIAQAQSMIVSMTQLPTTEATSGLILLAWASYGQGNESGFWQYCGMAIRMGMDIGIHEVSEIYDSPQHVVRTRLLWWTLFVTDRIIAFQTGRPASIPEDCIEIPLPTDGDCYPDPARDAPGPAGVAGGPGSGSGAETGAMAPPETIEPAPFVYFVRLMVIVGRISNVLNGRRGKPRTLISTSDNSVEHLAELQARLVQFTATLPDSLRWSGDNFRHAGERGHCGIFLALHLWCHAVLALTYHPELLKSPTGFETPFSGGIDRNTQLALSSARQISECMVYADLFSKSSYVSTPFLVQPLFTASMALIHEVRVFESQPNATGIFFASMARQNLSSILKAIANMSHYWIGVDPIKEVLEQRTGTTASTLPRTVTISLPDTGLLRRFQPSSRHHPYNIAQPTESSLVESIARTGTGTGSDTASPFWLADLMNGYTVEAATYAPANAHDLGRLLDSAG